MIKVFISCPYTLGDVAQNVKRSIMVADKLMNLGYIPFNPLLSHFSHLVMARPYEDWLKLDNEWLKCCDVVLRLSGESKGADKEVLLATELGIPVFTKIEDLKKFKYPQDWTGY